MAGFLYRIGRAGAAHRLVAIGVWLVLAAIAVVSVGALGAETNNTLTLPGTDSQAAFDLLEAKFPPQQNGANPFVFEVDHGTLNDATYKPALDATYRAFKASRYVYSVQNPVGKNAETAGIISDDGRIGLMPVVLNVGGGFITTELAERILDVTRPARAAGIHVAVGGTVGSVLSAPDTKTSQLLGNLSAAVILALVFGSLVAMGLPIVNAAIGLAITTSVIGLLGHVWSVPTVADDSHGRRKLAVFAREPSREQALRVLGAPEWQAPDLIVVEIGNVAWKKASRGEITNAQVRFICASLRRYFAVLHRSDALIDRAIDIALHLEHPIHDCLYLACAERAGVRPVTTDQKLLTMLAGMAPAPLAVLVDAFTDR